ncbi:hypothetical protein EDL99_04250 [Ornithobacterium rhinotracheale]|uniref:hypothetical protein n=1 Tax=Ornithobacterium rhinotracheale TaxID=28251 RepID=UPI00129D06AA|nr:hypothetical protein [Ornithobacterium rhinotracheale]MRJ08100.1 hypothetical protein [Ornithobacterium rhinotracheale]UOH78393.1 hypothetical protein MT996_02735 [Ornithobacterium rhinotracheale]
MISFFKKTANSIRDLILAVWEKLKKIFIKVLNFFKHIGEWFKSNLAKYKGQKSIKAISYRIENNLKTGNYETWNLSELENYEGAIVNTFYDEEKGEIIEENTEVIAYKDLDQAFIDRFKDKSMLIIEQQ